MLLLTFQPLYCRILSKTENIPEQIRNKIGVGIDISHQLVMLFQIQDDPVAVCAGQKSDSAAEASEYHGYQENTENDPPSFFHSAGTSL